jgi:hypothetical protein
MTPGISPTQHLGSQQILSDAGTLTVTEGTSTTTVLPIPPINIEVIPNRETIVNSANQELINLVANYQTRVSPEQLFQMETMEKISA